MPARQPTGRRPWWAPPHPLSPHERRTLAILGATFVANYYDFGILGLALRQIQLDLGIGADRIGAVSAVIRLGVVPAVALGVFADRLGRRTLLLVTITGFMTLGLATAFARTASEFVALQFLARTFMYAEEMLAIVVVAEALDARARGWGIGVLAALGSGGYALASLLFAAVEVLPWGWRALYVLGALPLVLVAWLRRGVPESRRFERHRRTRGPVHGLAPLRALLCMYPGRLAALAAAIVPTYVIAGTALMFQSKFLQETHGYTPSRVAALYLVGGGFAVAGNLLAGTLSDRLGRRRVLAGGLCLNAGAVALFYNGPTPWMPPAWVAMNFTIFGIEVCYSALGSELFPTSYRSTASAVRALLATVGGALGLWAEGVLFRAAGSHGAAITWLLAAAIAPVLVVGVLPETAARELEDIAPERAAPS